MPAKISVTLDTSCYARIEEMGREALLGPAPAGLADSLQLYLNKEALQESLGLLNDADPEAITVRARVVVKYWVGGVLRSPAEIIKSELAGKTVLFEADQEASRFRELFEMLARGTQPTALVEFANEGRQRKQRHTAWWQSIKQDFFEKTKESKKVLKLESWPQFRRSMWNARGLKAVGSRVPPNGEIEFDEVVDAVLRNPGEHPFAEAYLGTCLNFVHRMLRDPRSTPREPSVHDLSLVIYLAGLDGLVTSEAALGTIASEVFGTARVMLTPHEFLSRM